MAAYAAVGRAMPHCSAKLGSMMHSVSRPSAPAEQTPGTSVRPVKLPLYSKISVALGLPRQTGVD